MIPITGHTQLTALLGSPVAHSISPMMHNTSFSALGLDYVYLCFDINEQTLGDAVKALKTMGVKGFNLTMPNKTKILEYLDELSPAAKCIGAVNTVENKDGKLIGHNTDGIGFMRSVKEHGIDVTGKNNHPYGNLAVPLLQSALRLHLIMWEKSISSPAQPAVIFHVSAKSFQKLFRT